MGMHKIRLQPLDGAPRRARAQQPVGGSPYRWQHHLLHAVDGLGPGRDQRYPPTARQHLARPALHVNAGGVAEQAQVGGAAVAHASGALPPWLASQRS